MRRSPRFGSCSPSPALVANHASLLHIYSLVVALGTAALCAVFIFDFGFQWPRIYVFTLNGLVLQILLYLFSTWHWVRIAPVSASGPLLMPAAHTHHSVHALHGTYLSCSSSGLPAARCRPAGCSGELPEPSSDGPGGGFLRETYQKWAHSVIEQ